MSAMRFTERDRTVSAVCRIARPDGARTTTWIVPCPAASAVASNVTIWFGCVSVTTC